MVIRLFLVLVLALGATPMAASCHAAMAGGHHQAGMTAHHAEGPANHQAVAEHGCIGCAALDDWLAERVVPPLALPAARLIVLPSSLIVRATAPPMLQPPRIG